MTAIDRSLIAALPKFLTWTAGTDLLQTACKIYVCWSYDQLRTWSEFAKTNLFDVVRALPKPNQQRLLLAPRTFNLLQSSFEPNPEKIDELKKLIGMEQYLCHQSSEYPRNDWAALGDYYLPLDKGNMDPLAGAHLAAWSPRQPFKAPTLGHIVLDAYSPYPGEPYPEEAGALAPHTTEEITIARKRLEQSLNYVSAISRVAGLTVDASIQVVTAACAPNFPDKTANLSMRSMIGRVGLLNLHSDKWTVYKTSNALVHEAIHSLIYKLELVCGLYTDEAEVERIEAVSPWTGRTLFVHSFVHACFVWFGLYKFWSLADGQDPAVREFREKALRGFLPGSPLTGISKETFECIQPDVRLAIEEMYDHYDLPMVFEKY
jgi:hypothetical protein